MESIDKITLELLINKNQYNKYLSKEDPKKFRENQEYLEKIKKYKEKILNLSKQFLENPEISFNLEMNEMFSIFAKTSIKYLEMKELENENLYNYNQEDDNEEESLFGTIDETNKKEEIDNFQLDENTKPTKKMNSFWGSNIKKNDGSIPKTTMDMFIKNHKNRR
jgi:hypothetical protein